jgi:hypothetical protein
MKVDTFENLKAGLDKAHSLIRGTADCLESVSIVGAGADGVPPPRAIVLVL